ncbi:hypothetical protein CLDAP_07540 [Caldilinea aerophila DSM 14535 = NBRC 104270]|uniref:Uncharacterized protein n=1 Tax=Caldilinea aerophila (strain DSM 14535 / JCM 11387 / NBRC 104270 / STL-6-O1) TaxID=926550 RepID=I0I0K6_CALAS|nr:hypothetical protein CLDAP_07540 [Caldilinea aerophila DSM 14535 = NBRC 104270]
MTMATEILSQREARRSTQSSFCRKREEPQQHFNPLRLFFSDAASDADRLKMRDRRGALLRF